MLNPYLDVVIAAIIWGSAGVFIKYLNLPITTITFFRVFIPAIILLLFFAAKKTNVFKKINRIIMLASLLDTIAFFFYFISYTYTSIANSLIILFTWPIFAALFSAVILKEKIAKRNLILLGISFVGIALVYSNETISFTNKDFIGMSSMLVSAVFYSLSMVLYKKTSENYSNFELVFYQNMIGAVVFLPVLFISRPFPTPQQSAVVIFYAVLVGIIGYALFFSALKRIKASTASFLSYIEIISGITFGILFFNEAVKTNVVIGGILIIISTVLLKK